MWNYQYFLVDAFSLLILKVCFNNLSNIPCQCSTSLTVKAKTTNPDLQNSPFPLSHRDDPPRSPPLCGSSADSQGGELFMCRLSSQVCPCFSSPPPTHQPTHPLLSPALHHLTSQSEWLPAPWTPCRSALQQEKYFGTKIYSFKTETFFYYDPDPDKITGYCPK